MPIVQVCAFLFFIPLMPIVQVCALRYAGRVTEAQEKGLELHDMHILTEAREKGLEWHCIVIYIYTYILSFL